MKISRNHIKHCWRISITTKELAITVLVVSILTIIACNVVCYHNASTKKTEASTSAIHNINP